MTYRFLSILLSALSSLASWAMPARQSSFVASTSEGEPIELRLMGDEYFHYFVSTSDGTLYMRQGDLFVPAELDSSLRLRPAASPGKAADLAPLFSKARQSAPRIPGLVPSATFPARGEQPVLVVLVEYQDIKFNLSDPNDYFTRMLNEEGFAEYYATGSARDWFINSSQGQFSPRFDVFGPVTLQKNRQYYGGNDAFGQDSAPQKMAVEACRTLNPDVDFSIYDCDSDGYIDNVFVVYAGRGEASGGPADSVWPHAWSLSSAEPGQRYTFDGVILNRYACSNEWELSDQGHGYRPVGIGTFVHEFSHVMGLPDLYSTQYVQNTFTPGAWSAMDYGPYNNDGCTPPQYSAWERASLGYSTPAALPLQGNLGIEPLGEGLSYIATSNNENEYFILENRRQTGWDAYVPGCGLLIWHIDYDPEVWRSNSVNNNPSHNHVDIIEADGTRDESSRDGDSFPGAAGISTADLRLWNGSRLGISLSDISMVGDRVALRINGGTADIASPQNPHALEIGPGNISFAWNPVEGALAYNASLLLEDETICSLRTETPSAEFSGLSPDTSYTINITADDGAFGSEPTTLEFTTLPPTLDYLTPLLLPISDLSATSFLARWEEMALAEDYLLSLWSVTEGERPVVSTDFSEGLDNLPEGFSTNSAATYGMASYSGAAVPALRLAKDGEELAFRSERDIHTLDFWHRGNSTGENETLIISISKDGFDWLPFTSLPVISEKGGEETSVDLPERTKGVKILFNRPDKGSVAIDDVRLSLHGDDVETPVSPYPVTIPAPNSSFLVEGLSPLSRYAIGLTARSLPLLSLPSEKIYITTPEGLSTPTLALPSPMRIEGRRISSDIPFSVYTAAGNLLAYRTLLFEPQTPGMLILLTDEGSRLKIFIR